MSKQPIQPQPGYPSRSELIELRRKAMPPPPDGQRVTLAERFLLPPFSVLDARQGYWQKRKRAWIELGIQSELGRGENYDDNGSLGISHQARSRYKGRKPDASTFNSGKPGDLASSFKAKQAHPSQEANHKGLGIRVTCGAYDARHGEELTAAQSGTSIFDPVLCEIAYRWFCPLMGRVLDPFAGGSVRGIVAAMLGRSYRGIDLRLEQADANHKQMDLICPLSDILWEVGDAHDVHDLVPGEYDFLFSCPPYADLERYSDDPRDLSTMGYPEFIEAYRHIICESCAMLKPDRFACFVVGDIRDRDTGNYRNFVGDTVEAFRAAGLELYNEAILVTSAGSLPIRVGKQFSKYRKLGKSHQNVLVFLKGDAGCASQACGQVDVDDMEMPECKEGAVVICAQDCEQLTLVKDGSEVQLINLPTIEAGLYADILRGQARVGRITVPRVWVGTANGWERVQEYDELTYLIGDTPYLNRTIFPDAPVPSALPPAPKKLRGG